MVLNFKGFRCCLFLDKSSNYNSIKQIKLLVTIMLLRQIYLFLSHIFAIVLYILYIRNIKTYLLFKFHILQYVTTITPYFIEYNSTYDIEL